MRNRSRSPSRIPFDPRPGSSFFDRQARARRLATLLIVAFVLCPPAMFLVEWGLLAGLRWLANFKEAELSAVVLGFLMRMVPFQVAAASAVVGFIAARNWLRFAGDGPSIAAMLGARWISSPADRPEERRLLNVVAEMAIAAGTRAPSVFVLDGEPGINAFAAGTRRDLASIIVTRGALEYLTRDELQGLVAHELSHIVHGDMALNLRMLGLVSGLKSLLDITVLASRIARLPWFVPADSGDDLEGAILVSLPFTFLFFVPALLIDFSILQPLRALGAVCMWAAQVLHASVSRSREDLADATAVQYTRQGRGIAGCLEKIGGLPRGGEISHPLAPIFSHMLFCGGRGPGRRSRFATHPPLADRIKRLDPSFDGGFEPPRPLAEVGDILYSLGHAALNDPRAPGSIREHRLRAEALIARARLLKRAADETGDPRLRAELRRLEAERRDLWIDAGQVLARATPVPFRHGGLSAGVGVREIGVHEGDCREGGREFDSGLVLAPPPTRPRFSLRRLLRYEMHGIGFRAPAGCRPTTLMKVVNDVVVPFAVFYGTFFVLSELINLLYGYPLLSTGRRW